MDARIAALPAAADVSGVPAAAPVGALPVPIPPTPLQAPHLALDLIPIDFDLLPKLKDPDADACATLDCSWHILRELKRWSGVRINFQQMSVSAAFWATLVGSQWLSFYPNGASFQGHDLVPIPLLHLLDRQLEVLGRQVKVAATAEADAQAKASAQMAGTVDALSKAHKRLRQA